MEDKHTWNEGTRNNAIQKWSVDAITSAADRLGISALDLAEALQDGGIAELVRLAKEVESLKFCMIYDNDPAAQALANMASTILAKIRKEKE